MHVGRKTRGPMLWVDKRVLQIGTGQCDLALRGTARRSPHGGNTHDAPPLALMPPTHCG